MCDVAERLEQTGIQKGRNEERINSIALVIHNSDEQMAVKLLNATPEEIQQAKATLISKH